MRKLCFYILAVGCLLLVAKTDAAACSCVGENAGESLEAMVFKERAESAAVFTGKVLRVTRVAGGRGLKVEIRVITSFKGQLARKMTIRTNSDSAACGVDFERGRIYLIYAYGPDGGGLLGTNNCTRTKKAADAKEELEILVKINNKAKIKIDN